MRRAFKMLPAHPSQLLSASCAPGELRPRPVPHRSRVHRVDDILSSCDCIHIDRVRGPLLHDSAAVRLQMEFAIPLCTAPRVRGAYAYAYSAKRKMNERRFVPLYCGLYGEDLTAFGVGSCHVVVAAIRITACACARVRALPRRLVLPQYRVMSGGTRWGCDDVNEGTLHNGFGDARVNGLPESVQTDAETDACIASLERARRDGRERSRETAAAAGPSHGTAPSLPPPAPAGSDSPPIGPLFESLQSFTLQAATAGGAELKLFNAMASPDRQLLKAGYFVCEGSLVVQQILKLGPSYKLVSMLGTEAQLQRLAPELKEADAAYSAHAGSADADAAPCVVFSGSRADVSDATGFKHSALSVLAIARRPAAVHRPLAEWLSSLSPVRGAAPTLLVLDGVIKPENVGALFRTALAFGVSGVVLSPGCADPLYRKSIRASMGGCFKLPYMHCSRWPAELDELSARGYKLLALHLQGSVAHSVAIPEGGGVNGGGGVAAPFAVMVGAEYEGVSEEAATRAHQRVRIPMSDAMQGSLDSLNVNVAAAIVLERVFACNE